MKTNKIKILFRLLTAVLKFCGIKLKNIIAIFISLLLLFNAAGFLLIFKIQQTIIQYKVYEKIEKYSGNENLEIIIVDESQNSNFCWLKEGKEFRYNGKMYDVVSSNKKDGKLILYCRNDTEEEELFNNICLLINKNISKNNLLTFHISTFLKIEPNKILPFQKKEAVINLYDFDHKEYLLPVPEPPPRFV